MTIRLAMPIDEAFSTPTGLPAVPSQIAGTIIVELHFDPGDVSGQYCLRDQLMSLARRVRRNTYRQGMERFVIEREAIADTLERMAEEVGT